MKSIMVPHLFWRQNGDVVLVDEPGLLLNHTFIGLLAELLACEPEQHVFFAELSAKKLPERVPPCWTAHQLVKRLPPHAYLLQRGLWAACKIKNMGVNHLSD